MGFRATRRAATAALVLALSVAGLASADTAPADADPLTPAVDGSRYLGELPPGGTTTVSVGFTLRCGSTAHVERGSTIVVDVDSQTVPLDGAAAVTPGAIGPVPADWPLPGESCPGGTGDPSFAAAVPVSIEFTAPTTLGTGYEYTFLFSRTPSTGVSGIAAVSFTLDVAEPAPVDATAPVLSNVPSDIAVTTTDSAGATVTWLDPTATDDTDPNPSVVCAPASGSRFPAGATVVTCTATDATGNSASASFTLTVDVVRVSATWGAPLGPGMPALVANRGRAVPLKVDLVRDGARVTPAGGATPTLVLGRLDACGGGAVSVVTVGPLAWDGSRWTYGLDTGPLARGCWRVSAVVGGLVYGSADLLVSDASVGQVANAKRASAR